jgi:hypothetical protein
MGTDSRVILDQQQVSHPRTLSEQPRIPAALNPPLASPRGILSQPPGIVDQVNRRTLLAAAGWLSAATLAVAIGIAALSVIGTGLTTPENKPLSAAEVDRLLREQPPVSPPVAGPSAAEGAGSSPAPATSVSRSPGVASKALVTRGGTVVARCAAGQAEIVTMSPRPGFSLHEQQGNEGEFRSTSDNHNRVKFTVTCSGGQPTLALRSGGGSDD